MIFAYKPFTGGHDVPMRVVGANIPYEWLVYVFMFIPLGFLFYGAYRRFRVWRLAQSGLHRNDQVGRRVASWLFNTFSQAQVLRKPL
ncbi:MAG TPA: FeS-binding protein, partial [Syntrophomonas sp.]|nr:FeS-binding protein [Syntrophomonas sp.]